MLRHCMRGSYTEGYKQSQEKVPERRAAGQLFTQESRLRTGVTGDSARKHGVFAATRRKVSWTPPEDPGVLEGIAECGRPRKDK